MISVINLLDFPACILGKINGLLQLNGFVQITTVIQIPIPISDRAFSRKRFS